MRRFVTQGRLRWMFVATAPLLGCGNDDSAGGSSHGGSATVTTDPPGTTTDLTPTTSASDSDGSTTAETSMTITSPPTTTENPPPTLEVDCGAPPKGAQGAAYTHQPSASGGVPGYMWSATGLPAGLSMHPGTGKISGVPAAMGQFDVEITVSDVKDTVAMATCPALEIGEMLAVDHEAFAGDGPCVVAGGKTILDYITGGDGSPITCKALAGPGNGKLPQGLGVDPDTCEITGTVAETRFGGWAWIVGAEQSGATVHAPYCATQLQQAPKAYAVTVDHSGQQDNGLTPMVVGFEPDQPLRFDGDADPYFSIIKGECGGTCFFGFTYQVTASPFGAGSCLDDKDGCLGLCPLIPDPNQPDGDTAIQCSLLPVNQAPKIGFAHEMWAKGDVPPEAFKGRPFVVQWSMDYCLSETAADCQGKAAILANGDDSSFEFPVIFRPQ